MRDGVGRLGRDGGLRAFPASKLSSDARTDQARTGQDRRSRSEYATARRQRLYGAKSEAGGNESGVTRRPGRD
jgi:hypothetical protein